MPKETPNTSTDVIETQNAPEPKVEVTTETVSMEVEAPAQPTEAELAAAKLKEETKAKIRAMHYDTVDTYENAFSEKQQSISKESQVLREYERKYADTVNELTQDFAQFAQYQIDKASGKEAVAPKLTHQNLFDESSESLNAINFNKFNDAARNQMIDAWVSQLVGPKPEQSVLGKVKRTNAKGEMVEQPFEPAQAEKDFDDLTTVEKIQRIVALSDYKDKSLSTLIDNVFEFTSFDPEDKYYGDDYREFLRQLKEADYKSVFEKQLELALLPKVVKDFLDLKVVPTLDFIKQVQKANEDELLQIAAQVNAQFDTLKNFEAGLKAHYDLNRKFKPSASNQEEMAVEPNTKSQAQMFLEFKAKLAEKPKPKQFSELSPAIEHDLQVATLRTPVWKNGFWNKESAKNYVYNDEQEVNAFAEAEKAHPETLARLKNAGPLLEEQKFAIAQQKELNDQLASLHINREGKELDESGNASFHITNLAGAQEKLQKALEKRDKTVKPPKRQELNKRYNDELPLAEQREGVIKTRSKERRKSIEPKVSKKLSEATQKLLSQKQEAKTEKRAYKAPAEAARLEDFLHKKFGSHLQKADQLERENDFATTYQRPLSQFNLTRQQAAQNRETWLAQEQEAQSALEAKSAQNKQACESRFVKKAKV